MCDILAPAIYTYNVFDEWQWNERDRNMFHSDMGPVHVYRVEKSSREIQLFVGSVCGKIWGVAQQQEHVHAPPQPI